jgi:hypothetical protein
MNSQSERIEIEPGDQNGDRAEAMDECRTENPGMCESKSRGSRQEQEPAERQEADTGNMLSHTTWAGTGGAKGEYSVSPSTLEDDRTRESRTE